MAARRAGSRSQPAQALPSAARAAPTLAEALAALPEPVCARVQRLARAAEARGLALYLVGGPVRDLLLGRPLRDADLTVAAPPGAPAGAETAALAREAAKLRSGQVTYFGLGEETAALAREAAKLRSGQVTYFGLGEETAALAREAALEGDRVVVHPRFGTVRIETREGAAIDLATVRSETYAAPGALPSVAAGTLEQDLRRRDFTLNALALPMNDAARTSGGIVDPGGGLPDLAAGELRVFHAASFRDDPTRAFRAARFAARFGLRLARESRTALRSALRQGAFGAVSGERFAAELEKLFEETGAGGDPARALALLDDWHVLPALEPGLDLPRLALAPLRRFARALTLNTDPGRPWVAGLMVWLAAVPTPLARRALARLAIRGAVATRIAAFPRTRDAALRAIRRARGRGAVDAALRALPFEELRALRAWAPSGAQRRIDRHVAEDRNAPLPVTGDDLLAIGLAGPGIGRALARIRIAWLDRAISTREEALGLARELAVRARRSVPTSARKRAAPRRDR